MDKIKYEDVLHSDLNKHKFKKQIMQILEQDLSVLELAALIREFVKMPGTMEVEWENFFKQNIDNWTFSIGQLKDGSYFWTWFEYINTHNDDGNFMFFMRPNTIDILEIGEDCGELGCLGGYIFDNKKELIDFLYEDDMYTENLNEDGKVINKNDDFYQFVNWVAGFLKE
jgi:hypothetical protein